MYKPAAPLAKARNKPCGRALRLLLLRLLLLLLLLLGLGQVQALRRNRKIEQQQRNTAVNIKGHWYLPGTVPGTNQISSRISGIQCSYSYILCVYTRTAACMYVSSHQETHAHRQHRQTNRQAGPKRATRTAAAVDCRTMYLKDHRTWRLIPQSTRYAVRLFCTAQQNHKTAPIRPKL